jgi:hypothetical protein
MTEARLVTRCPYRAGWCEKDADHDGSHYTTYRDGEIWTLPAAAPAEGLREVDEWAQRWHRFVRVVEDLGLADEDRFALIDRAHEAAMAAAALARHESGLMPCGTCYYGYPLHAECLEHGA